jgi:hypothetical protein
LGVVQDKRFMKDIQTHLDKIRSDAAECLLLSSLATDGKRDVFAGMAQHLNALAFELEKTLATAEANNVETPDHKEPDAPDVTAPDLQKVTRPRRLLLLLPVIFIGAIAGALVWANSLAAEKYWSLLQAKHEPSPAPQGDTKQAIADLLSGERAERKMLAEQVSALAARIGDLEKTADTLKKASADSAELLSTRSTSAEEKPALVDDGHTSASGTPAVQKQMDGHTPTNSDPPGEPADRVGAISPRRAELDSRKTGPFGCTQFRSYDPASGTYITLDGRRRQCR